MIRRCTAALLILCFGLFSVESLIADAHDGDAPASEQVRYSGVGDHSTSPSSERGDVHSHPSDEGPSNSGHSLHSCHSGHAHVGLTARGFRLERVADTHAGVLPSREFAIAELRREPHLRPPIV